MVSRCVNNMNNIRRYIIHFANEHLDFRIPELKSIISSLGCEASIKQNSVTKWNPFLEIHLNSEQDAINIMKRSVLSKRVYELLAEGSSLEEVKKQILDLPADVTEKLCQNCQTYRIMVETVNKKITGSDKIKRIEFLTDNVEMFNKKINLKSPDTSYHLLECYQNKSQPEEHPVRIFFGRWVADGQRSQIQEYHLQKRKFIANTSMDACLSMVMANMAQIQENDLVLDPFVGSGSLLVSCAHYGAYVMGTDIDYMLLHARAKPSRAKQKQRSKDEGIYQNLRQYGLEGRYIDAFVADASRHRLWRQGCRFSAIVTDPPYGIREAANRVATTDKIDENTVEGQQRFPQKEAYDIGEIFTDLLNFAVKFLEVGGHLVYWLPIYRPDYKESNIPQHPCLRLDWNCEQPLSTYISRRLVTMVKIAEPEEIADSPGASVDVDHYDGGTFRQKYFKMHIEANKTVSQSS